MAAPCSGTAVPVWLNEDDLSCVICQGLLDWPTTLPCGHSFCLRCLNDLWDSVRGPVVGSRWACPICRKGPSTKPELHNNPLLQNLVDKFRKAAREVEAGRELEPGPVRRSQCGPTPPQVTVQKSTTNVIQELTEMVRQLVEDVKSLQTQRPSLGSGLVNAQGIPPTDPPPATPAEFVPIAPDPDNLHPVGSDSEEEAAGEGDSETEEQVVPAPAARREFHRLHLKSLRELHTAVRTYGLNDPFTLYVLDWIPGGRYKLPGEWVRVVQSVLTRGQFLLWKAEFLNRCQSVAALNQKSPRSPSATWTFEKLSGQGKYTTEARQQRFPIGLLAQTANAALSAWRTIPARGSVITPLAKVIQGAQEDYTEFVSRLLEVAERIVGHEASDNVVIKQLAYENANSACQAVLRSHFKDKDLGEMILLCRDVDTFTHEEVSQAVHLAVGAALQHSGPQKGCFKCGQPGHFARQCLSMSPSANIP